MLGVYAYLRALFFLNNEEFGHKCIFGQAPSVSLRLPFGDQMSILFKLDASQKSFQTILDAA